MMIQRDPIQRGTPFEELKRYTLTNYRLLADDDRSPHWLNGYRTLPIETRAERCESKSRIKSRRLRYRRAYRPVAGFNHSHSYPCTIISTGTRWHKTPGLIRKVRKLRVRIQFKQQSILGWLFADTCCGAGDGDCKEPPRDGYDGMCYWCWEHWTEELHSGVE